MKIAKPRSLRWWNFAINKAKMPLVVQLFQAGRMLFVHISRRIEGSGFGIFGKNVILQGPGGFIRLHDSPKNTVFCFSVIVLPVIFHFHALEWGRGAKAV